MGPSGSTTAEYHQNNLMSNKYYIISYFSLLGFINLKCEHTCSTTKCSHVFIYTSALHFLGYFPSYRGLA